MTGTALRILVVGGLGEDVQAIDAGVRDLGLSVDWVEPAEASRHFGAADVLALVLDLDTIGLGLARRFRETAATRRTPVLFLAAPDAAADLRARAYALAPANCLTRPAAPDIIRAQVELNLDLRRHPSGPAVDPAIREGETRVAALADRLPDVAVYQLVRGPGGGRRFTYISAGIQQMLGVLPAEVTADANALYGLIAPEDLPGVVAAEAQAGGTQGIFDRQFRQRTRTGEIRWVRWRAAPRAASEVVVWDGLITDVTAERQAVDALRESDRQRDDYLAMLAHELRNPLGPLRTGLHVLGRRSGDPHIVTETRAMMGRQVDNMARIVDDLLDVSRVARGKVTVRKSRIDLADVARTCTEDRRPVAEGSGLRLQFAAPGGPVWVDGDATRLSQVLDNLIQNAVKFTPKDGILRVLVAAEGDQAVVRVRDTGLGIDRSLLPRLFEVFTQADRSLDRSRGGLGLGLALVKGLVELHGGTVEADSEGPGRGSEFIVRLPRAPEPAALTEVPVSPSSVGKRRRVLVVEDNRDSAESLRMLLDLSGYEVEVAYTGNAGIEAAVRFRPHAVVCDIGLPELDGYGVARALRQRPETADVRLIAVTGYGRTEDIEKARRSGFNKHLTKPVDPQELLEQLVFRTPTK